jgi:uncharacterized membrane protein
VSTLQRRLFPFVMVEMRMRNSLKVIGFLKTTAIGGLFFLLPLIVMGAVIGQIVPIVLAVATVLYEFVPLKTPAGIALLILLAIVIVILLCFAAGLLARRSFGKRISAGFEKKIMLLFPRYAIFKEQMAGSIGGDATKPNLKPVLAKFDDSLQIGFEASRVDGGLVTVYLPGAPDPWSGRVVLLTSDRVEPLDVDFGDTLSIFEKLGRDSARLLAGKLPEPA